MSLGASFRLKIERCSTPLHVVRFEGVERVHAPLHVQITVRAASDIPVDPETLLGERASFELAHESDARVLRGVVDAVEQTATGYRITLASRATALQDNVDHHVFLDQDAVAIAEGVLRAHGISVSKRLARTLPKRAQCVQAFESDLAFVSRILAEEGILWHLEHEGGEAVVFTDNAGAYLPIAGAETVAIIAGEGAGLVSEEAIFAAVLTCTAVHDKLSLSDYDFERPLVDQTVSEGSGPLERFEYPGGYTDPNVGEALAGIRLEEAQARRTVLHARTTSRRLAPGATFKLAGVPRDDLNGTWLVLELHHQGADEGGETAAEGRRYEAELVAVPVTTAHRPARAEAPTFGGVQTATTTGASGAESTQSSTGASRRSCAGIARQEGRHQLVLGPTTSAADIQAALLPARAGRCSWASRVCPATLPTSSAAWATPRRRPGRTPGEEGAAARSGR